TWRKRGNGWRRRQRAATTSRRNGSRKIKPKHPRLVRLMRRRLTRACVARNLCHGTSRGGANDGASRPDSGTKSDDKTAAAAARQTRRADDRYSRYREGAG